MSAEPPSGPNLGIVLTRERRVVGEEVEVAGRIAQLHGDREAERAVGRERVVADEAPLVIDVERIRERRRAADGRGLDARDHRRRRAFRAAAEAPYS